MAGFPSLKAADLNSLWPLIAGFFFPSFLPSDERATGTDTDGRKGGGGLEVAGVGVGSSLRCRPCMKSLANNIGLVEFPQAFPQNRATASTPACATC